MTTYPQLLPFASANAGATIIAMDVSAGVQGNYPGTVSVLLNTALTLLPHAPGQPGVPGLCGAASPAEYAGLVLAAGTAMAFLQTQAVAIVAAGCGTITSLN
jgi:hypothetical protein